MSVAFIYLKVMVTASRSPTEVERSQVISVTYMILRMVHLMLSRSGEEVLESVTLADGLTLLNQSIAVAVESVGFDGVDGILG